MENVRASESEILAFFLHLLNLAEQTEHGANNKLTVDLSVQELSEALQKISEKPTPLGVGWIAALCMF